MGHGTFESIGLGTQTDDIPGDDLARNHKGTQYIHSTFAVLPSPRLFRIEAYSDFQYSGTTLCSTSVTYQPERSSACHMTNYTTTSITGDLKALRVTLRWRTVGNSAVRGGSPSPKHEAKRRMGECRRQMRREVDCGPLVSTRRDISAQNARRLAPWCISRSMAKHSTPFTKSITYCMIAVRLIREVALPRHDG